MELLPVVTAWMELESIMLSEISQGVKEKYHMILPISGTKTTKQISKSNITRDIEIKNKLTVTRRNNGKKRGESHQGTSIKDPWAKPNEGRIEGGRWEWLRWQGVVGGKWKELYLKNNKKKRENKKKVTL